MRWAVLLIVYTNVFMGVAEKFYIRSSVSRNGGWVKFDRILRRIELVEMYRSQSETGHFGTIFPKSLSDLNTAVAEWLWRRNNCIEAKAKPDASIRFFQNHSVTYDRVVAEWLWRWNNCIEAKAKPDTSIRLLNANTQWPKYSGGWVIVTKEQLYRSQSGLNK